MISTADSLSCRPYGGYIRKVLHDPYAPTSYHCHDSRDKQQSMMVIAVETRDKQQSLIVIVVHPHRCEKRCRARTGLDAAAMQNPMRRFTCDARWRKFKMECLL